MKEEEEEKNIKKALLLSVNMPLNNTIGCWCMCFLSKLFSMEVFLPHVECLMTAKPPCLFDDGRLLLVVVASSEGKKAPRVCRLLYSLIFWMVFVKRRRRSEARLKTSTAKKILYIIIMHSSEKAEESFALLSWARRRRLPMAMMMMMTNIRCPPHSLTQTVMHGNAFDGCSLLFFRAKTSHRKPSKNMPYFSFA